MSDVLTDYHSLDDDEKIDRLCEIIEDLDADDTDFIINELENFENIDEDVVIELLKVISLYSNNDKVVTTLMHIFNKSDDLVKSYALQGLEHFTLSTEHKIFLEDFIKYTEDSDLKATAEFVVFGRNS